MDRHQFVTMFSFCMMVLYSRHVGAAICTGTLGKSEIIECALDRSLEIRQARQELTAISGRRIAAGIWLPSNPLVSATVAHRGAAGGVSAINWYVTLSQEIEIAGQRSARLDAVDSESAAQIRRVAVAEQEQVAQALSAYYDLLAAKEALLLAVEVSQTSDALGAFATERVKQSLMAPVDADLLRAESVRVGLIRYEIEKRQSTATALLAMLLGLESNQIVEVTGNLESVVNIEELPAQLAERAILLRGEVAAAEMERKMLTAQLNVWRRSRIPNVTLAFTAQNDGFNEQVLGGSFSLPIPLPSPIGRTYAGQIAETRAQVGLAETSTEIIRRRVRQEVFKAWTTFQNRSNALKLFSNESVTRVRQNLNAIREGLNARQLSVREALLAERTFIEFLLNYIETRASYALASVGLIRAAGLPFSATGGTR